MAQTQYSKQGQNLGYNASVTFFPLNGAPSFSADDVGWLMKIDAKQDHKLHQTVPMSGNGQSINDITYHGWSGDMEFTRDSGALTRILQALELNQYNGGTPIKFNIQVQTTNPDASVDTDMYNNCIIFGENGSYAADKPVTQKLNFVASSCTNNGSGSGNLLSVGSSA